MLRDVSLDDISDGYRYHKNDLVKVGCNDCAGCSSCCENMHETILLDPLDVSRICKITGKSLEELIGKEIELLPVDGLVMPVLSMNNEKKQCSFLNEEGRCSIHEKRPGICRLFPLGRVYNEDGFDYFLQVYECPNAKTKVKVKKWIGEPDIDAYEEFVWQWHQYIKKLRDFAMNQADVEASGRISVHILQAFYLSPYRDEEGFYEEFHKRLLEDPLNV